MKKWIVPVIIIVLLAIWGFNVKNTSVVLNEDIKESWGNVQNAYQRRNDLIGNLVNTVKGAADFERGTLT
ncbi:MAG: LemA protein, partial [Psychroserpens sp.]